MRRGCLVLSLSILFGFKVVCCFAALRLNGQKNFYKCFLGFYLILMEISLLYVESNQLHTFVMLLCLTVCVCLLLLGACSVETVLLISRHFCAEQIFYQ